MCDEPILPFIQPVTINTMLNNNGPNIGDGLNFVKCERYFTISLTAKLFFFPKVNTEIQETLKQKARVPHAVIHTRRSLASLDEAER